MEARTYVHTLGLKRQEEWKAWMKSGKRPHHIPSNPNRMYSSSGWTSWGDFLGFDVGKQARNTNASTFRSFEEAREYVRTLGLKSAKEWQAWSKSGARPHDIPANPNKIYKSSGWMSFGDFLGYADGKVKVASSFRSFKDARAYVRTLGLKSQKEWEAWSKSGARPHDIPANPNKIYKSSGWMSFGDFLGYADGKVASSFRSFEDARKYVRTLGLKSFTEWTAWSSSGARPYDIPSTPHKYYASSDWLSYGDFLGAEYGKPTNITDLCGLLERAGRPVVSMVKAVAPRLHEVSPLALAAEAEGKQSAHGSRPAMAAVGLVLGEHRRTKLEEDHPDNPRYDTLTLTLTLTLNPNNRTLILTNLTLTLTLTLNPKTLTAGTGSRWQWRTGFAPRMNA